MDYLTNYYKNLCEQLQERINILEKFLIERPSIEDQIETGVNTIDDVALGKTKGFAQAGKTVVPFDILVDPTLPKATRGEFRFSPIAVTKHLYPDSFQKPNVFKMALNPEIDVVASANKDGLEVIKSQDTVAHESGGHAHQMAAMMRDAEQRRKEGKRTYSDVELLQRERERLGQTSINPKLANASTEVQNQRQYSQYFLDPAEVNARSAGAGTMAHQLRRAGLDRDFSSNFPKQAGDFELKYVAGGSKASPEEAAAMTRHERSDAKRKNLLAQKDLRDATARGVLKAEKEMATPSPEAEAAKARQEAIRSKIAALKGQSEQPKISTSEVSAPKGANIASTILDPTSAAIEATATQASKVAPRAALKSIPGSKIPGVGAAANVGAGVVGGLAGEYVVKPAAEEAGVFDAVERGSRAAFSQMPDWSVKAADVALGAAQAALDPMGAYNEFLANQARTSPKPTTKDREKAEARYDKQNF